MSYIIDLNKQKKQICSDKVSFHLNSWPANIEDYLNYMCPHFPSMQMTQLCFYSTFQIHFLNSVFRLTISISNNFNWWQWCSQSSPGSWWLWRKHRIGFHLHTLCPSSPHLSGTRFSYSVWPGGRHCRLHRRLFRQSSAQHTACSWWCWAWCGGGTPAGGPLAASTSVGSLLGDQSVTGGPNQIPWIDGHSPAFGWYCCSVQEGKWEPHTAPVLLGDEASAWLDLCRSWSCYSRGGSTF